MRWSWPLDAWRILINLISSRSFWSRRILNPLIFKNKYSLNRNWILFILLLKKKITIAWKGNCFTLICFFFFKPLSWARWLSLPNFRFAHRLRPYRALGGWRSAPGVGRWVVSAPPASGRDSRSQEPVASGPPVLIWPGLFLHLLIHVGKHLENLTFV